MIRPYGWHLVPISMPRELILVVLSHLMPDRHVLVSSTFPSDTSFEVEGIANFGRASTYRAVLTRHMSPMDYVQTAPRITTVTVAPGTESMDLTFSSPVCGSPETGCAALTADHFEVMHYGETETTALTISPISLTGNATAGYTVATLNLPSVDIGANDYLLVRTARNSRFSDNFITDRTIFSTATTERTIPFEATPYSEAESGMLHLQGGALVKIPIIKYSLAPAPGIPPSPDIETDGPDAYSIREGRLAERTTSTFTITRAPEGVNFETAVRVTITNTAGGNPLR